MEAEIKTERNAGEFDRILKAETGTAEEAVRRYLPKEDGLQSRIIEAMNYSLTAGGKRLRSLLMRETWRMCGGGREETLERFMAAMEMIHTYSLVHDDLPAMDNDKYRRGKETTWYVYGDAMGILAGDGLLNYAFETALGAAESCLRQTTLSEAEKLRELGRICRALSVLARKAGIHGMIGGQAVDIMTDDSGKEISEEELLFIHEHKTAALIQAAMMIGAILAGASEQEIAGIEKCAYNIGIAFQIQDDILDVTGDSRELGKPVGSDVRNHRQTYVTWKGLEGARADVEALSGEAVSILKGFEGEHAFLEQLILSLIYRRR